MVLPCPVFLVLLSVPCRGNPVSDSDMEGTAIICCQEEKCLLAFVSKPNWSGFILAYLVFCYYEQTSAGQADIRYSWLTVSHTSIVASVKPFRLFLSIHQLVLLLFYCSVSFCLEYSTFTNQWSKIFWFLLETRCVQKEATVKHGTALPGVETFVLCIELGSAPKFSPVKPASQKQCKPTFYR